MNQANNPATLQTFSRRSLLKGAAGLAAATIVPRHVLGGAAAPSNKIALAAVGVGGVGFRQVQACEKEGFRSSLSVIWTMFTRRRRTIAGRRRAGTRTSARWWRPRVTRSTPSIAALRITPMPSSRWRP